MPDTAISLQFGDAEYRFWLPMARIIEIERLCGNKSILEMHDEMGQALGMMPGTDTVRFIGGGAARIRDVYEIIRCAAIGGNERRRGEEVSKVSALEAKQLVDDYVDGRPLAETIPVAWAILNAAVHGVSLKKKADEPAEAGAEASPSPSPKA